MPSVPQVGKHYHDTQEGQSGDAIQHHAGIGVADAFGKKDWHDWEAIAREEQRTGEWVTRSLLVKLIATSRSDVRPNDGFPTIPMILSYTEYTVCSGQNMLTCHLKLLMPLSNNEAEYLSFLISYFQ